MEHKLNGMYTPLASSFRSSRFGCNQENVFERDDRWDKNLPLRS